MSRAKRAALFALYGLLCALEWCSSKARERIESVLFPTPIEEGDSK